MSGGAGPDAEAGGGPRPQEAAGKAVEVTDAKLQDYLGKTQRALAKVTVCPAPRSHLRHIAEDMLSMAQAYYDDACHFAAEGDRVTAFAAVSYAHGWLDAGVRLGLLDGKGDDQLFTLAE